MEKHDSFIARAELFLTQHWGQGENICKIEQLNENLSLSAQLIMTRIVFVNAVLTNDGKRILINLPGARHIV